MAEILLGAEDSNLIFIGDAPRPYKGKVTLSLTKIGDRFFACAYQVDRSYMEIDGILQNNEEETARTYFFVLITEDEANEIMKEDDE